MENKIDVVEFENSSAISSIAYHYAFQVLEIKFVSGGTYEYRGVPASVVEEMKLATSAGQFFHTNIKNKYEIQ